MAGELVVHRIAADRDYYLVQVGRALEVRARDTHAVLQVLEPPREWGDDWLWSSCGFDGLRCVPCDEVRFLRASPRSGKHARNAVRTSQNTPDSARPEPDRGQPAVRLG